MVLPVEEQPRRPKQNPNNKAINLYPPWAFLVCYHEAILERRSESVGHMESGNRRNQHQELECDGPLSHLRAPICATSDALCIGRVHLEAPVALPAPGELGYM
jgi:hypothetical protein